MWWLNVVCSVAGASAGHYMACDVVFARFAISSLYPDNLERAIRAINVCNNEGGYGFAVFSFIVGAAVGAAAGKAHPVVGAVASFLGAVAAGAMAGYAYYLQS